MKKLSRLAALLLVSLPAAFWVGRAQEIVPTTALTTAEIDDPSFGGKKAFTVNVPTGWLFQGTVVAELSTALPSPVFRAYSPDGLTEIRLLPAFQWIVVKKARWKNSVALPTTIYLTKTITASSFLNRYVFAMYGSDEDKVHIVGPMSVGTTYQQQVDSLLAKLNAGAPSGGNFAEKFTGSTAALRIETVNGTFRIEQRLRARVICRRWRKPRSGIAGDCSARIDVLRAPKGQLDAVVDFADAHNLANAKNDDAWLAALVARIRDSALHPPETDPGFIIRMHAELTSRAARAILFRQAVDLGLISPSQNEDATERVQYAPLRGISDWADYAIDLPARLDSAIVQQPSIVCTWVSTSGQRYSTVDPHTNPNHLLPGSWTEESAAPHQQYRTEQNAGAGTCSNSSKSSGTS